MHHLFRINEVVLGPIDIIAKDRDHAALILISALTAGLSVHPGADFSVSEWTARRLGRFDQLRRWAEENRAGIVWSSSLDGEQWEYSAVDIKDN